MSTSLPLATPAALTFSLDHTPASTMSVAARKKLLENFYLREGRRLGKSAVSSHQPVASTSRITPDSPTEAQERMKTALPATLGSLTWSSEANPFVRQKRETPSATGRTVWHSPRYSIRRQKTLARALNAVQLEPSEASTWILPTSSKVQAEATNRSRLQQKVEDYLKEYANTNVQGTEIALTRGPYKGRTQKPLKLHKWEREAESIKRSRQEKLKAMPVRIADYMKVSILPMSRLWRRD